MPSTVAPLLIIERWYTPGTVAYRALVEHSRMVADLALRIAERTDAGPVDLAFIEEASMLHDIGIFLTDEPKLGCHGDKPYLCHGYLGRELLDREGLPGHALVCERHVGVGLTVEDIERHNLPLPRREMLPLTLEEKIICYADKFFSKYLDSLQVMKDLERVRAGIRSYGEVYLGRFDALHALFGELR